LTREGVLRAAIALADERGIEALSMRKLGQELGVEAMSLYNHVANKDDLLGSIKDLIVDEIDLPAGGGDWQAAMRRSAISAHRVLRRHPWVCGLWTRATPGPAQLRYMESLLACLRDGGFGVETTYHGYHVLDLYVVGFTIQQLSYEFEAEQIGQVAADFLAELSTEDYPHMSEHVRQHIEGREHDSEFEFGLDLILDGLARMREVR
jgi:AcrR family transcriptional regulator